MATPFTPFPVKKFTQRSLASTRRAWQKMAGAAYATECAPILQWAEGHVDYSNPHTGDSFAYGLFGGESQAAEAILDVVLQKNRGGLTKLLKITVSPEYWAGGAKQHDMATIFASGIIGTILLSKESQCRTVKIYGRTEELLSILHSVRNVIEEDAKKLGIRCTIQGRWLELSTL
ncbi:hypothetical protein ACOTB6_14440 [Achromobacter xylosoxidans]